jgi:carbon-monoxide dehydrogenase small subunit
LGNITVNLTVNGEGHKIPIKPHWTLLQVIRNQVGLTGTKKGCGTGECGACIVIIDGKPINSCLTLAAQADGKNITTIEGISKGDQLHPIQEMFSKLGAVQCGFCTPGMILVAKALLDENPNPTEEDVREAFSGNLCRCTGYVKPVKATLAAAKEIRKD